MQTTETKGPGRVLLRPEEVAEALSIGRSTVSTAKRWGLDVGEVGGPGAADQGDVG
jgi:hypothetical protein